MRDKDEIRIGFRPINDFHSSKSFVVSAAWLVVLKILFAETRYETKRNKLIGLGWIKFCFAYDRYSVLLRLQGTD